ncbi:DUF4194 domain-containing protein [Crateriforma conspicua]|uniref:DUF4194 domain-containing protein n=1 Tax=Crateriforma conspicua TaxID=2527996 RepID=A0A5C6FSN5_9PLAN|nr:DUF4194 domain-containing protein [Crateriforma conspicua]TWU64545.1 hypothetical protein V7x_00890 [Crateriforma conspicua]
MTDFFDSVVPDSESDSASSEESGSEMAQHGCKGSEEIASHADLESQTPSIVKQAIGELLKTGVVDESAKRELFGHCVTHQTVINQKLEPLDLALRLDTHRGVAFVVVADGDREQEPSDDADAWSHPLVRRQRLTLEQSLLIALLRQAFVMHEQEMGVGQTNVKIAVDELLPQYLTYFGDSGSDQKNESRLLTQLDHLKGYGVVSGVDKNQEVTIRPLIAHLANPRSLTTLLETLQEKCGADTGEEKS